jgi:phage terminase large subunit
MWFDADKARKVIKALKNYHYKYDEEKKLFSHEPVHDDNSHYADATEIIGLTNLNMVKDTKPPPPRFLHEMTADEVFWGQEQTKISNNRI